MRTLKENGTSEAELKSAIHELLRRKQELLDREREPNAIVSIYGMHACYRMRCVCFIASHNSVIRYFT